MTTCLTPISVGELVDKITILTLKEEYISDPVKLANVKCELASLLTALPAHLKSKPEIESLTSELREINRSLWHIEDDIRDCERRQDFGPHFIELARSVYFTNDRRATIKRSINTASGSALTEEKSYQAY